MDENVKFQSEFRYDLPLYKELVSLNIQTTSRQNFALLVAIASLCLILTMLPYVSNYMLYALLSLVYLGTLFYPAIRNRNGGVGYKQILRRNNGEIPRNVLLLGPFGIKTVNPDLDKEAVVSLDSIRRLHESKNLLILEDDLGLWHILNKNGLEGGSRDEVIAYLQESCPKLKKHIRTGRFGRFIRAACMVLCVLTFLASLFYLLEIPEKLSGQLSNSMSYQEMAAELEIVGIHISDQAIRELEEYDASYALEYGDYYKENRTASKVMDLLYWEGCGIYDEETGEWTPSTSGIFWFDMEAFNVSRMYTDLLTGVGAMDEALSFTNITEDYSSVNWDTGLGIATVSFDYCGKTYRINASFDQDWIDPLVITHIARILDQDDAPEKLWYAYDGQALYLYYGTPEQEALLENKTGYIWLDPVNNPLYSE